MLIWIRRQIKVLFFLIIILFAIPFPTTTAPEWRVRFVDAKGGAIFELPVEQTWRNYSIESNFNSAESLTDSDGYVVFPERQSWAPLIKRVLHPVNNFIAAGVHASYGSTADVIPLCSSVESRGITWIYERKNIPKEIMLKYSYRSSEVALPGEMPSAGQCSRIEEQVKNAQTQTEAVSPISQRRYD